MTESGLEADVSPGGTGKGWGLGPGRGRVPGRSQDCSPTVVLVGRGEGGAGTGAGPRPGAEPGLESCGTGRGGTGRGGAGPRRGWDSVRSKGEFPGAGRGRAKCGAKD